MNLRTALVLGRVSNLPTVWTNAAAGMALTGGVLQPAALVVLLLALSLFYTGGMYLNDAFDAGIDRRERANRPIPAGLVAERTVWLAGAAQLAAGGILAATLAPAAGVAAVGLGAAVLAYDAWHKKTRLSPLLMGLARVLVYVTAAAAAGAVATGGLGDHGFLLGALGLFCWVVGLTYAAKQEAYDRLGAVWPLAVLAVPVVVAASGTLVAPVTALFVAAIVAWMAWALRLLVRRGPGDVPRAVVSLIAGIALYDAALIAATGATGLALAAVAGFGLTLALQRVAPGT